MSDGMNGVRRAHVVEAAPFAESAPNNIKPTPEAVAFDAARHLQLEAPAYVKMLVPSVSPGTQHETDRVRFPVPLSASENQDREGANAQCDSTGLPVPFTGLAYTAPFRVFSDEGLEAFRRVVVDNEQFAGCVPSLVPKCIRGLGYRSKFVRDFNYSKPLLNHLSSCAGIGVGPHDMGMNLSQVNFGEIGGGVVNAWHLDSVPFVMVILLSDHRDMEGGELLVARLGDPHKALEMIRADTIDPAMIDRVNYPGAGYAIFMQGSQIAHAVTSVTAARERRLTCVNSYQSLNPFSLDRTVYRTFSSSDGDAPPFEFARHVAWRVRGQLDYLLRKVENGSGGHGEVTEILRDAAAELERARGLVTNTIQDERPYDTDGGAAAEADAAIQNLGTNARATHADRNAVLNAEEGAPVIVEEEEEGGPPFMWNLPKAKKPASKL